MIFPNATSLLILKGRITFETPYRMKPNNGAGCGSVLVAFGEENAENIAIGFTLTGFDKKEPGASPNHERIEAMRELHNMGFQTFASIEPVITPAMSMNMMIATRGICDLYMVGLISGKGKDFYNEKHVITFDDWLVKESYSQKIYLKDSFLNYMGINRRYLKAGFVKSDYNIFKNLFDF